MLSEEQLGEALTERLRRLVADLEPSAGLVAAVHALGEPERRRRTQPRLLRLSRPRWALAGAIVVALVAVNLVLSIGPSSTRPAIAFAGWRPTPARLSGSPLAIARRACGKGQQLTAGRLRIVDVRGPYVSVVYAMPLGAGYCVSGNGMSDAGFGGGTGAVGPAAVQTFLLQWSSSNNAGYTALYGRAGSRVTGVAMRRADGHLVTATLEHGWYLLWWPSRVRVTGMIVDVGSRRELLPVPAGAGLKPSCGNPPPGSSGTSFGCATTGYVPPPRGIKSQAAKPGIDRTASAPAGWVPKGMPLVGSPLSRPWRGTFLLTVYTARHVRICFALHPRGTLCEQARMLLTLPRGYPIQRNLLQVFPDEVWLVRVPAVAVHQRSLHFTVTATNSGMRATGRLGLSWPPGPLHGWAG